MKYIKALITALLMCTVLSGCGSTNYTVYTYNEPTYTSPYTLTLDESKKTFQFVYSSAKYLPYGKYTEDDDKIYLVTSDQKYNWIFEKVDENTLKFVADGSTESLEDGTLFTKKTDEADTSNADTESSASADASESTAAAN